MSDQPKTTIFRKYFEKSSKFKIITDFAFYLFIVLMLIPTTRTPIAAFLIRATMFRPKVETQGNLPIMQPSEYQMILEDLEGNTVNLASYSNQVIFVNFWATWCPPCRAEMPSIQKLFDAYGKKISFFLITNEDKSKVEKYLKENNYKLPVYFQRSASSGILDVSSLPTSLLISGKAEILVHKKGAANWNSEDFRTKLDEILSRKNN
jgi:thiol-disulfide isomerase/thioredoxin